MEVHDALRAGMVRVTSAAVEKEFAQYVFSLLLEILDACLVSDLLDFSYTWSNHEATNVSSPFQSQDRSKSKAKKKTEKQTAPQAQECNADEP